MLKQYLCIKVIMRDKYTNRPRGFGFLTLEDGDAAARICQENHVLDGRQVTPESFLSLILHNMQG